jgi:hypothetical protein
MAALRPALGGMKATAPRASSSARSQSTSKAFAEQGSEGYALDQRRHAERVMALARQQHEAHEVAEGVDEGDDLGGQAAAGAADGLLPGPPFAPLAFWWAVAMVPSTRAYSKSGSSDTRRKTR